MRWWCVDNQLSYFSFISHIDGIDTSQKRLCHQPRIRITYQHTSLLHYDTSRVLLHCHYFHHIGYPNSYVSYWGIAIRTERCHSSSLKGIPQCYQSVRVGRSCSYASDQTVYRSRGYSGCGGVVHGFQPWKWAALMDNRRRWVTGSLIYICALIFWDRARREDSNKIEWKGTFKCPKICLGSSIVKRIATLKSHFWS